MAEASALCSRIEEIQKLCTGDELEPLDAQNLLEECALHVQSRVEAAVSELSGFAFVGAQDFDACLEHLKEELNKVEAESRNVGNEIELLTKTHKDDCHLLQAKLEEIKCSLDYSILDQKTEEDSEGIDSPMLADDCTSFTVANQGNNLEKLQLDSEIDEMASIVKSLEDLQCKVKWFDAVEQIEEPMAGLKVLAFDDNCIRVSLRTCVPKLEGLSSYLERVQDTIEVAQINHELLIEVFEGTMKLKNVQVFPNDIYMSDIVDAAKSVSKSSLQWFVIKVQDRIILSTLRHLVVKDANKSSGYTLEYLDKEETIIAHMAGGIDAYIKLSHGWPLFASPLTLISVKGSSSLEGTSLSFHGRVETLANSFDSDIRQNMLSFVDAVEKVLKEQLQVDLPAGDSSA